MKSSHFRFSIYCLRMGAIFASFATVLPFGLSLDAGAGALRFDMGTGDSPVRPGYTRVTAQTDYAAEQGYGWAATEGLADADYAAPQASAPIFADALLRDFVFAERPATFKLKVANGTYGVFLVCGAAHVAFDPPFFDVTVRLEGNEVGKLAIPQPRIFERKLYVAQVNDGTLDIEFSTSGACWLVNGLIVFPVADAAQVRDDIQDLGHTMDWLPTQLAAAWQEAKPSDEKAFTPSDEQKQRGYVLFTRGCADEVSPRTAPRGDDLLGELRLFAAQGEYEPTTLSVWPLKALKQVRVTATDLAGPGGIQIPATQCQVRLVRCIRVPLWRDDPTNRLFRVVPWCLEPARPLDVAEGQTQSFWITVRAPEDAAEGVCSGTLRFAPDNAPPQDVPIRLRVLPFRLERNPQAVHAVHWQPPIRNASPSSRHAKQVGQRLLRETAQQLADIREHGLTSVALAPLFKAQDGRPTLDLDEMERTVGLVRDAGLAGPLILTLSPSTIAAGMGQSFRLDSVRPVEPPQGFFELMADMVRRLEERRHAKGWPEFIYLPIDGDVSRWNAEAAARVLDAVRQAPGVKTCVVCPYEAETVETLGRRYEFRCYRLAHGGLTPYDERWVRSDTMRFGQKLWLAADEAATDGRASLPRFLYGLYAWRFGVTGFSPRAYQGLRGAPFNAFAYEPGDAAFTRPGADGPLATPAWEMMREGMDDSRYLYTLETLIKRAKDSGRSRVFTEALAARRELLALRESIPTRDEFLAARSDADRARDRWRMAWWILRLGGFLAGAEPKPPEAGYGQTKVEIVFKPDAAPAVAPAPEALGRLLCPNVPAAPSIDGHLDDACWQNAGRVEAFVDARTGHAPPVKTVARLASDANNLYVAFECFETDLRLARECQFGADLSDAPVWLDEAVSVCIDQDHDHGTFFQIAVNAAGASADWKCTPQADWGWHSKARVKTTVLADRWCVEMAIPKRTLTEVENDIWAFGLGRRRHAPGCDGRRLGVNCQCPQFVLAPPGPLEAFKGLEAAGQPGVASGRFPDAFWHLVFSKNTCFVSDITRLDLSYGENVFMAQVANVTAAPLDVVASLGLSFGDKPKRTNYKITLPANHTTEFGFPFQLSPYGAPRQYGGSPYGAPRQYGGKAIGRCTLAFVLLNAKTNEPLATVVRNGLETPAPLSLTVEPVHYLDEPRAVGRAALQLTPEAMQNTRLRATVWPLGKKPALATIQAEVLWGRADIVVPLDGLKPGAFELEVALVKDGQDVFSRRNAFVKCDGPFPDMP